MFVLALALSAGPRPREEPIWASLRWLAQVDLRVLAAILTAALVLTLLGCWAGWRAPRAMDSQAPDAAPD